MIEDAEKDGRLKPETIIEGTLEIQEWDWLLAAIIKGYKCIFRPILNNQKKKADILRALGAEVVICPTDVKPTDPRSYYQTAKKINRKKLKTLGM